MLTSFWDHNEPVSYCLSSPKIVFCSIYLNKDSGNDASQYDSKAVGGFDRHAGCK